jgi:hypothetical protein
MALLGWAVVAILPRPLSDIVVNTAHIANMLTIQLGHCQNQIRPLGVAEPNPFDLAKVLWAGKVGGAARPPPLRIFCPGDFRLCLP